MLTLDIFKGTGFTLTELTAAINKQPFVPGQAGRLNIFEEKGIHTTTLEVEELSGQIYLIPDTPRGSPAFQNTRDKRKTRFFKPMHLLVRDTIMADEIQNKKQFGVTNDLATAQSEANQRMAKMNKSHDTTVEYGRIGALKGVIYDADGTTIKYNLFDEFEVTQNTVDFDLGNANSDLLGKCTTLRGNIQDELGANGGEDIDVFAFVGATFWTRFISHPAVATAYKYYQTVQQSLNPLQRDLRYVGFKFGDVTFVQYRGAVSSVTFVAASEGTAFPTSVPDLYDTYYAPADYMETVNTEGLPRYARMAPDPSGFNKFVVLETQSNPISICKRPKVLNKIVTNS